MHECAGASLLGDLAWPRGVRKNDILVLAARSKRLHAANLGTEGSVMIRASGPGSKGDISQSELPTPMVSCAVWAGAERARLFGSIRRMF